MVSRNGLILANRAYLDHESPRWADSPSSSSNGGLLAALRPVIEPWEEGSGTTWIGAGLGRFDREWTDDRGYELPETPRGPLRHRRLYFGSSVWHGHYVDVANSFLWPLVHLVRHDLPSVTGYYPAPATPTASDWRSYLAVNTAFAEAAATERYADWCWVHDYQLSLVPALLRERQFAGSIGFFLHTPFPSIEVAAPYLDEATGTLFRRCVDGMLGADLVGLQTPADVRRFCEAAAALCGATACDGGVEVGGRYIKVRALPVGIDVQDVVDVASAATTPPRVKTARRFGLPVVVGLERGDFTKGIPERLRAIASVFRSGRPFSYIGIAAPTREGVHAYDAVDRAIEEHSARARRAAAVCGGSFVHVRANVGWPDVVALQREADVIFTSSLADGQNLVPLQAAVAQSLRPAGERAVIITGQDAGAASTFAEFADEGLVAIDPLDPAAMQDALADALRGLPGRISDRFVAEVRRRDALAWATSFLTALEEPC
jgi:trehalose 6-phosphate synthase